MLSYIVRRPVRVTADSIVERIDVRVKVSDPRQVDD
jgi:hypothetical protein